MVKPIPELEALREKIERRHIDHVHAELDLFTTFAELSRYRYSIGEILSGDASAARARQAVEGVRAGIARIASATEREKLQLMLREREAVTRVDEQQGFNCLVE